MDTDMNHSMRDDMDLFAGKMLPEMISIDAIRMSFKHTTNLTSEESKPSTSPNHEASAAPVAEDPKNQEDNSPLKENGEVSKIVEAQTLHQEIKEVAKEDQEDRVTVTDLGTEVGVNNEAKLEADAGASDRGEVESHPSEVGANNVEKAEAEGGVPDRDEVDTQPSEREAEVENGHNAENKAEPDRDEVDTQPSEREAEVENGHNAENKAEPEAGAEPDSQADEDNEAPAEPESDADDVGTTEGDGDEEEEKPRKLTVDDIKTAPMDFRFPTTNQAKHCFTRYVEYHKCVQAKGDDNPDCEKYARYYRSLCPGEWVDRWNEQRENGTFPGPL